MDHLVAIATIVSEMRSVIRSALVGMFWGLGHTRTASEAHGLASSIRWHSARPGGFGGLDAVGVDAIVRRRFATARLDVPARLWNRIDWRNASNDYRDEPAARISIGTFRTDQYTH